MGHLKFEENSTASTRCALPKRMGLVSCIQVKHILDLSNKQIDYSASPFKNGERFCGHPYSEKLEPSKGSPIPEKAGGISGSFCMSTERVRSCARGRPRRKSSRKSNGNQGDDTGKKSRDDKGEQKDSSRSGRGSNGGRGSGGNDDDRGKKDDDNEDDNEEDDDDENQEEEEEDGEEEETSKKPVGNCEMWSINEKNRDNDESVLEDMLRLVPSADLNCEPAELPAKPGSLVNLHGVVVHETAGGLVILNVRWRNKVYSGAFIDIKKNRWPADRLDEEIQTNGTSLAVNGKDDSLSRKLNSKKGKKSADDFDASSASKKKGGLSGMTGEVLKHSPSKGGKRIAETNSGDTSESDRSKKRSRVVERSIPASPASPPFIECPEPNCDKRYKHVNGLKYHQAHAHQSKTDAKDDESRVTAKRSLDEASSDSSSQTFSNSGLATDVIKLECIKKEEEEDYTLETATKKGTPIVEVKSEKEDYSDSCDTTSANGESVIVDVENTGGDSERARCTPVISVENMSEDKDDKASDKSFESSDSGNRLKPDRITLVPGENVYSLLPLMPPYFPSYLQHSPTLASLNPQTLNNSLSSALQPSREIEGKGEEVDQNGSSQSQAAQNKATAVTVEHLRDYEKGLAQYAFSSQLMSRGGKMFPRHAFVGEDVVIASDEENTVLSPDALPGLRESIFTAAASTVESALKDTLEKGGAKDSLVKSGADSAAKRDGISPRRVDLPLSFKQGQQQSMISSALFQQLSQERHITQLDNSNSNSDLAAPADIQHALSRVDYRRHFSPMLLSYLKPSHGEGASSYEEGENAEGKREAGSSRGDTSDRATEKSVASASKPTSTNTSTKPVPPVLSDDVKSVSTGITGNQLQPNISIGRPISRPVQKPESITGGGSSTIKYRDDSSKISVPQPPGTKEIGLQKAKNQDDKTLDKTSPESAAHVLKDTIKKEVHSPDSKTFPSTAEASTWTKVTSSMPTLLSKSGDSQFNLATSTGDRNSVEAKTWVPHGMNSVLGRGIEENNKAVSLSNDSKERGKAFKGIGALSSPSPSIFTAQGLTSDIPKGPSPFGVMNTKTSRGGLPVPIAPAPLAKPPDIHRPQERQETDTPSARDVPQMSRFTLTSDNRLVPSPAENRGRPRKVRVEKTQQIPIGTAHDVEVIARIEDRPKKQQQQPPPSSGNIMRASVIHSMSSSSPAQKSTFSAKEIINNKEATLSKPKPPLPERDRPTGSASNKSPLSTDFKRRSSFEIHGLNPQEKRSRVDGMSEGKRSPDSDERSKFKPMGNEVSQGPHRMDDRPTSTHSLGRPPSVKDDHRAKFSSGSVTPLPASISSDLLKSRTSLADSPYIGIPPQFGGTRIPPGLHYPLFLNPAFPRELVHEQMAAGCLPPGLPEDVLKGVGASSKERYERERVRSPGESSSHSSRDLPSPREHGLPHHLSKHPGLSGFGKSTPDPSRMSREALRTAGRAREQSPIFLGGHGSNPIDPSRGLRPSLENPMVGSLSDRPLFGSATQYHTPLSPSLMGRLRPEGPPDITNRQGQGRLHEALLDSSRLRREYPDSGPHSSSVSSNSRPTYMSHSQSAGPSLYADSVMNRSTPFGLRSPNLILRRADGAMVGPLPFDGRPNEANQR